MIIYISDFVARKTVMSTNAQHHHLWIAQATAKVAVAFFFTHGVLLDASIKIAQILKS